MTATPRSAGALRWGIRRSFVDYVRSLEDGEILLSGDAAELDDGRFEFPLRSADGMDPATGTGTLEFSGGVSLSGHFGMMALTVQDPSVEVGPDGATVTALIDGVRIPLADIDLTPAAGGGGVHAEGIPARLSDDGAAAFHGQYAPGDALDPLALEVPVADPGETASAPVARTLPDPSVHLALSIVERVDEAEGIVSLTLADPAGRSLPEWTPGSHIDVHLADGLVRQYSLSSSSEDHERWRITVLREQGGAASERIHSALEPGGTVEVSLPRNTFALTPAPRYVFVAGGIGITPLVPMIEAAERSGAEWVLVYSGRSRARMAFVEELAGHGERARLVATAEEPRVDFEEYFARPQPGTLVYACGPERLLQALEQATAAWPEGSLHTERFVAREFDDSADVEFEVEFADSGVVATVPVGRSILSVAEEHDIPVISSCSEGTCGTCESVVLAGIPDHRDSILTDAERAAGKTMYICVSRSKGGCRLTLDL